MPFMQKLPQLPSGGFGLPAGYDAGEMIHEISHALAPILMTVEVLRRKIDDPDVQRHLDLMAGHAWRGAAIVQKFVLLSGRRPHGRCRKRRKGPRSAPTKPVGETVDTLASEIKAPA
jgi:hypothetical protein